MNAQPDQRRGTLAVRSAARGVERILDQNQTDARDSPAEFLSDDYTRGSLDALRWVLGESEGPQFHAASRLNRP